MIEIVQFDHIAQAVPELDPQLEFLQRVLGFEASERFEGRGHTGVTLRVPGSSAIGWELLAPDGPDSYLQRFLDGPRGPGLHHLSARVASVAAAEEAIRARGVEPWHDPGDTDRTCYLHPVRGGHGFLFQFYEGDPWYTTPAFTDDDPQTLGIIALNHIAHAHPDRDVLGGWYEELLGYRTFWRSPDGRDGPSGEFATRVLDAPTDQIRVEVIQPTHPESFMQRFLEQRGPAVHHLTVEVADWRRAVDACARHGVDTFGARDGETDGVPWREAFIHPKFAGGVLLQFFWQAEPGHWI